MIPRADDPVPIGASRILTDTKSTYRATEPISILALVSTGHTQSFSLFPVWLLQYCPQEVRFIQQERIRSCGNLHHHIARHVRGCDPINEWSATGFGSLRKVAKLGPGGHATWGLGACTRFDFSLLALGGVDSLGIRQRQQRPQG